MPTASKLFATIAFVMVAFFAAETFKPGMPDDTQWGRFSLICAGIGGLCGWFIMGVRTGRGYGPSAGTGLRTSVTIVFWALLLFSGYAMIQRSLRRQYDGVFEAIEGTFDLILEHGMVLLRAEPLIVLAVGGVLAGMLAEWAGRQWR